MIEYGIARLGTGSKVHLAIRNKYENGKVSSASVLCGAGNRGRGMTMHFSVVRGFIHIPNREDRRARITCAACQKI